MDEKSASNLIVGKMSGDLVVGKIISDLVQEEGAENALIALYQFMIGLGVHYCFPPEQRNKLRDGMEILKNESRIHKEIVEEMLTRYKR